MSGCPFGRSSLSLSDASSDRAFLYDSPGDDTQDDAFLEDGKYEGASLTDEDGTYENLVRYFDLVYARSYDSADDTVAIEDEEMLAYRLILSGTW